MSATELLRCLEAALGHVREPNFDSHSL